MLKRTCQPADAAGHFYELADMIVLQDADGIADTARRIGRRPRGVWRPSGEKLALYIGGIITGLMIANALRQVM